jgi:hypothetical protein
MTRRDFDALAAAFAKAYDHTIADAGRAGITKAADTVADACEDLNPAFNRLLFFDAARVPKRSFVYKRAVRQALVRMRNSGEHA